jgi:MFS family permease
MQDKIRVRGDSLKTPGERVGVAAAFLIHATVSGSWAPRLPAIKASLDLSAGMLGTALVGLAVGLLAGTRLAGAAVDHYGSRPVMRVGFPVLCAVLVLPALALSAATLFLALLALGLASGMLDVAMNAQGVEVERHRRRALLSGLHGLWSVGLGAGAGMAALAAASGVDPLLHFVVVGAVLAAASLVLMRGVLGAAVPAQEPDEPRESSWTPVLVLLGVIAFCSFVGEGSASDWSAVYLAEELSAAPGLAAVAFACFSVAAAATRFAADSLRARVGAVALVRGGTLLAAAGLLLGLAVHQPAAAIVGFTLLGAGLAPVVPIAFAAAGAVDPRATGRNISRVAGIGYVGSVSGPIVIGWLAQATSLRLALAITAVLALVIAAAARAVQPQTQRTTTADLATLEPA